MTDTGFPNAERAADIIITVVTAYQDGTRDHLPEVEAILDSISGELRDNTKLNAEVITILAVGMIGTLTALHAAADVPDPTWTASGEMRLLLDAWLHDLATGSDR